MKNLKYILLLFISVGFFVSCNNNKSIEDTNKLHTVKGLYVYGPELKSFTNCQTGSEYWVADSSRTLELAYSGLNFEKPYGPVYVELECNIIESDTSKAADFDSTLVVRKMIRISKEIPDGPCSK